MSAQANVLAIHALDELRGALNRFGDEAQQTLATASQETRRVLDWLAERHAHWQRELRRRQEMLQQAQAALARCQSQVMYDRDTGRRSQPDCSSFQAQVQQARAYVAEAQAELDNVRRWLSLVQQAVADYERQAQRLAGLLASDLPKATGLLDRSVATLQAYQAISVAPGTPGPGSGSTVGGTGTTSGAWQVAGNVTQAAALRQALDRLASCAAGSAVASAIQSYGTLARFGTTDSDAIAHFDPSANEIVLNEALQDASSQLLAAHLAHEGTHVQWTGRIYSLDEEYHAFRTQAAVWNEVKGAEVDPQCDWVSGIIALGETRAKRIIAELYPDLPDYA